MNQIRILQLNAWTGRIRNGLSRFIAEGDYDIVCLQEAVCTKNNLGLVDRFIDTIDKIKQEADFPYAFHTSNYGISLFGGADQLEEGNAILSKIPFTSTEEKLIHGQYAVATNADNYHSAVDDHCYTAQKVKFENGLTLVNYHGYWQPNPIGNEITVKCMRSVADLIRNESGPVIMCGDLNVSPESPAMRELDFLIDLTAVNNIKTTLRNIRFVKDVPCDHILVSKNLSYRDFKVVNGYASDHQALTLTIDKI